VKYIFENTPVPRTRQSIKTDLEALGVTSGMTILVHSSLSSIGWTNGGAVSIIQALMDVVTKEGTIVMPSQSVDLSDPSEWKYPPVPEEWWKEIRDTMPAYHPDYTPVRGMGEIVEVFRTFPDVSRSSHPAYSFVAWGKNKSPILAQQSLTFGLGEQSPLARLYELDAAVLFIGVGYEKNTCFHLAEYRSPSPPVITKGTPILENGERIWKQYQELDFQEYHFEEIGRAFEQECSVTLGKIGSASSRLFSLKQAVDFAEKWLAAQNRE